VTFTGPGAYSLTAATSSDLGDDNPANNQTTFGGTVDAPSLTNAAPAPNYFRSASVTLSWSAVTWASTYAIVIDDQQDFSSPIYANETMSATTITRTLPDGRYYWKVRAVATGRSGGWSAAGQFTVRALPPG
jgi:hypothetical protein